jgi:uncharacterized protein (UPF0335 family)
MPYPSNDGPPVDDYGVTAEELRQFVERIEQLESEKKEISEQIKEVYAELKGRGYDSRIIRLVISRRKKNPEEIAETEAILETYEAALGIVYQQTLGDI